MHVELIFLIILLRGTKIEFFEKSSAELSNAGYMKYIYSFSALTGISSGNCIALFQFFSILSSPTSNNN